jgi:hypothetical protein
MARADCGREVCLDGTVSAMRLQTKFLTAWAGKDAVNESDIRKTF